MLLICSAWEEEIKYLREHLAETVQVETIGIGYLDAALSLQKILSENPQIDQILFIGTAGSYPNSDLEIGDLVNINSVNLLNLASKLGFSYSPENFQNNIFMAEIQDNGLQSAHCMSSLEISFDDELAEQIYSITQANYSMEQPEFKAELYASLVENMELYGLAKVAHESKIKWSSILGITNKISGEAHDQWRENHAEVSKRLCKKALNSLTACPL